MEIVDTFVLFRNLQYSKIKLDLVRQFCSVLDRFYANSNRLYAHSNRFYANNIRFYADNNIFYANNIRFYANNNRFYAHPILEVGKFLFLNIYRQTATLSRQ